MSLLTADDTVGNLNVVNVGAEAAENEAGGGDGAADEADDAGAESLDEESHHHA